MRKGVYRLIMIMLMVVVAISIFKIGQFYYRYAENEAKYEEIKKVVFEEKKIVLDEGNEKKPYVNPEQVGWIQISGTNIDYPVMQSKDESDFYLRHDYYGNYSVHGCPYLKEECNLSESDNLVIYGHHMSDGTMFAALDGYMDKKFWENHKKISFIVGETNWEYEVICAFKTSANGIFSYHEFIQAKDEEHFDKYMKECKKRSFYETGLSASYGDKLLTLSTCEYSLKNGRLVVVAKRIN